MPDDRSDSSSDSGTGRKAKPPVIELKATDVTPEPPASEGAPPRQEPPRQEQQAPPKAGAAANSASSSERKQHPILFSVLAGAAGILIGALALALVVLFAGDGAKKLLVSAAETVSGSKAASDFAALRERTDQLAKKQDEIQKQIGDLGTEIKALDLPALKSRLDGVESAFKDSQKAADEAKIAESEKLSALEAQVKQAASRPAVANAAEVVALGGLQEAIAKGAPFTKELNVVRSMLGDAGSSLASLEPSASTGLPTIAELRKRFTDLAPKLAHEPKEESGYFSRLLSNAGRLVEIRPVGEVAGTSAGAVVARIETRLARGDLAAALDEIAQLPAPAKAQAADWIAAASRRREADVAVKRLLDASLATPAAGPPQ